MASVKGQALTELSISMAVPILLLLWAAPWIWSALSERLESQQLLNTDIELIEYRANAQNSDIKQLSNQAGWKEPDESHLVVSTSEYPFAQALAPIINSLNFIGNSGFEINNLVTISREREERVWLSQSKLTDDWSPIDPEQLTSRPAGLTATYQLQRAGFSQLQSIVGVLPFAREFRPESFRPGHVDIDVTPDGDL